RRSGVELSCGHDVALPSAEVHALDELVVVGVERRLDDDGLDRKWHRHEVVLHLPRPTTVCGADQRAHAANRLLPAVFTPLRGLVTARDAGAFEEGLGDAASSALLGGGLRGLPVYSRGEVLPDGVHASQGLLRLNVFLRFD